MALYDGFFDAVKDETTGEYDRTYGPGDFTNYFGNVIGSGVCIHDNPDSFKAEYEDGTLYLRPGYLFIKGYWLANKAGDGETASTYKGYAVTLPTGMTGSMAVVAHLNLGQRLIEIEVQSVSQSYPDSLVLAIITTSAAEDTRHNTDICGVIDTAGELSTQVEWAVNYINTEIDSKLQQIEQDIAAQDAKLDAKIAEVQAVADSIVPPPVGTIKFSASQDVDENWLKCDGSFINEADYPELVAALGKLIPSADKFQVVSSGEIGTQITNGVVYDGRMWVYSYSTKKLYGVDLEGTAAIKEISVTSENERFNEFLPPTTITPLCLSIIPHKVGTGAKLFLTQIVDIGSAYGDGYKNYIFCFSSDFSVENNTLSLTEENLSDAFSKNINVSNFLVVPYVTSFTKNSIEKYRFLFGTDIALNPSTSYDIVYVCFGGDDVAYIEISDEGRAVKSNNQRVAFSKKTRDGAVYLDLSNSICAIPKNLYEYETNSGKYSYRSTYCPVNIAGKDGLIFSFEKDKITRAKIDVGLKTIALSGIPYYASVFVDAGAYLWNKDIYMIFVGTGIIFSRTLEEGDFGYLDTTSVMGTITQFGYLDYSEDGNTLYLLGQDTDNNVKVAKMKLNTLYDYANDGAWLPMIASDGVPAYIKAKGDPGPTVPMTFTIEDYGILKTHVYFNGENLIPGTYTRDVAENGKFTVGIKVDDNYSRGLKLNDIVVIYASGVADLRTAELNVNDYISGSVTISVYSL